MIADLGFRIWDLSLRPWRGHGSASIHNPQSAIRNLKSPPRGISLMEVLISMFVLLFGLMGVAAIFPVGNHYVIEGEKYDLGQLMAENAFEELQARGILRPELWWYSDDAGEVNTVTGTTLFIQPSGAANPGYFNADPIQGSGHAFVIDPLGTANGAEVHFPSEADIKSNLSPWNPPPSGPSISGTLWPVRRMTLPIPDPNNPGFPQKMTTAVAETIFRLRDDLAVEMPERDDVPSIQRWVTADIDNNGNANNTPNDPNDDTLLTRQYHGNFSWLATVVPLTEQAHEGLQPALRQGYPYEVSVVVFYKRDTTPSEKSERLLNAEMIGVGELALYGASIDVVDEAVDEIRPGDWVAVMGVNQTTGAILMKWYRLLALDDETHIENLPSGINNTPLRYAMIAGPDWPATPDPSNPGNFLPSAENLRVAILPGIASVVTREMVLEQQSMWNAE